ncbi:beta-galactosidase [Xylanivirga thermophila]|uniref:beta-galactosidase n=1 Tax=Xylanivirga thermophila TaxID=2496273 RepID=UPI00101B7578|nr:beta-galactosidase [Xylanivirga thermophila]
MKYPPINCKYPHMLHGGDYNPDQWIKNPEILDEDIRLMKLAHCNVMSVGIFAWDALEPEEGKFQFEWLDNILDKLADNNIYAILATPSGARPLWLAQKYPEVLRVRANRVRNLPGERHNHCFTSPIYREKTRLINKMLADRYKDHPALLAWHISNEYSGECHCPLCQDAFRTWLKQKYGNDLDKLNYAWWTAFWGHTYTDWSQIQSPAPNGDTKIHGLNLDWMRFVTHQTLEFYKNEIAPLKEITPNIPVTTNFMGTFEGLNYWEMAPYIDVISWDNYPQWHGNRPDWELASDVSFVHDINRSLKGGKPFMLMESTPSMTNWQPVSKLKRPGMHLLSSIHAIAHGSDTVQYFQWRKGRGGSEKFHGAVVDHCGHENTRVFNDVTEVGKTLEKLDDIVGTTVKPEVAIIYDWENRWAIDDALGPRREKKDYLLTCQSHYRPFWNRGISVDVIDMDADFSNYKLLIAPMLYMVRPGVAERIEKFVKDGGTFITTYWSGIVDENDLCFLGGFPGPLKKVTGIWSEEIDALYDDDVNFIVPEKNSTLELNDEYEAKELCDLIHTETAHVLARYKSDFYAGRPALTVNEYGKGKAYYIAFRNNNDFLDDFYEILVDKLSIKKSLDTKLPLGVTAQLRTDGENKFIFLLNFAPQKNIVDLKQVEFLDILSGEKVSRKIELPGYGLRILKKVL